MSNKCEICYDTNIDYCITQEELDKALEGMLSKDELRYYTTQEQVDLMIEAAQIQAENKVARNYYNKGEIDTIVEALPTKQWVRSQGYVNESDVKDIVDESIEAADINIDLSDYYTKAQVDQKIADAVTGGDIDLEGYVTDSEMKDAIDEAINEIDLTEFVTEGELYTVVKDAVDSAISNVEIPDPDLTDYYTKQEVDNIVDGIDVDLTGYATENWVQGQGYLKTIPSDYVTESEMNTAIGDYYTKQEVDDIIDGIETSGGTGEIPAEISVDKISAKSGDDLRLDAVNVVVNGEIQFKDNPHIEYEDISNGIYANMKAQRLQATDLWTKNIHLGTNQSQITFVGGNVDGSQIAAIDSDGNIYEGDTKLSDKYALKDEVGDEIPILVINTPHGLLCDDDGDGSYNTFENATYDGTKVGEIIDCILNNKPYKILAKQVYDDGSVREFIPVEIWFEEGNAEFSTPRSIMVWFRMSANGSIVDYPGVLEESNNISSNVGIIGVTKNSTYTSTKINQLLDEKLGDIDTILNNILYTV